MKESILIVEDERIIACDIKDCLEKFGYDVPAITAYGEKAIQTAEELNPDLILMDIMLKGKKNGIEAAEEIITRLNIPIIFLTAYSDEYTLNKAKTTQPFGYILKPFEETQLVTTIEIALNKHRTEEIMREALLKEKEMRQVKSRFVSMVSHEFRNPLSTIFTSTEILIHHNHKLNENKRNEYFIHIQNAVKHLSQILNDVLNIETAEAPKVRFNPQPLDLHNFCEELIAELKIGTSNIHEIIFSVQEECEYSTAFTFGSDSSPPATTTNLPYLDRKLLRHILTNLLTNAIKYSPQGGTIRFDLFYLEKEVIFRIQDEGIGIPEADQENLFTSFHRARNVGNIPGTGLGLSIVKQYVDIHGGEINIVSKEGVGSTFIVSIPSYKIS
ncbi:hybrid sensor histidine kinase/response regulator [Mastigocoleus testarum]|uniref:histidine kinase n=1 Tax=Mastigocoleus testarum BC008 TaxID=371196 RepID=A0A0V7ZIY6_9CYAN|nr:ATP-binding protein [Mastigocoleus testarum]KST64548.1 histidine kinase [Mastigocoleus testarum BC008]